MSLYHVVSPSQGCCRKSIYLMRIYFVILLPSFVTDSKQLKQKQFLIDYVWVQFIKNSKSADFSEHAEVEFTK